jgi:Fe-S-cluster containining protein
VKSSDEPNALDGWSDGLPPCTACGVCCFFDDPRYVMVFESDEARLGEHLESTTHWISGRRFMRQVDGHCIALRQEGEFWLCSIHEHRPQLCRDFERGCETCRALVPLRHPRLRKV